MKKIALFSAIALCSTAAIGAESNDKAKNAQAEADKACCEAKCNAQNACGDEECWLDVETITVEAANGDPIAQYTVAYLTETGDSPSEEKTAQAHEWYAKSLPGLEKAAAEGSATACRALAHMYAEGKGVEKNPEMAAKYKKMYKEICAEKCKKEKDSKACCPMAPKPAAPAQD